MKNFNKLSERETLALAISPEDTHCDEKMAVAAKTIYKLASDPLSTALCD